jgi:hypothetical protein
MVTIMLVEDDIYELPMAIEDSALKMARLLKETGLCDVTKSGIEKAIRNGHSTKMNDGRLGKFIRVEEE